MINPDLIKEDMQSWPLVSMQIFMYMDKPKHTHTYEHTSDNNNNNK